MLFDGIPAKLPTATLLSGGRDAKHRVIGGHLRHWLDDRWAWLRPRTVPMIVAFVGMLAVLGSTRYLSTFACAPRHHIVINGDTAPPRSVMTTEPHQAGVASPGHLRIVPVRPGSHDVTITIEP
jgi:hypothetical protein